MTTAKLTKTEDLNWKNGFVQCACGWRKDLGDGFNGYHIASCPQCDVGLTVRDQRKVIFNDKVHRGLTAEIGSNRYFVIENGIYVRFAKQVNEVHYGLTEKQADRL